MASGKSRASSVSIPADEEDSQEISLGVIDEYYVLGWT